MDDFDAIKAFVLPLEEEKAAYRKRQLEIQELDLLDRQTHHRLDARRETREEAVARMSVDKSISWDEVSGP